MNDIIDTQILLLWNLYAGYLSYAAISIACGILLFYAINLVFAKSYHKRYEIISQYEITALWRSTVFLLSGAILYVVTTSDELTWLSLIFHVSIAVVTASLLGYALRYVLRFYYPFFIEKRLQKLRYRPRTSPDSRKMKLLSEEDEDLYLDEGMQAEEDVFSIDYDVWVDEVSGYTQIEKYSGKLFAVRCPRCTYCTMKAEKEEVTKTPNQNEKGSLIKFSLCKHCGHRISKEYSISPLKNVY